MNTIAIFYKVSKRLIERENGMTTAAVSLKPKL